MSFFNVLNYLFPTLLSLVVIGNSIVFLFSSSWSVFLINRVRVQWLKRRDIPATTNEYTRTTIELNTNIFFILVLIIEALHLFIKGIGFGLFFLFGYLPTNITSTWTSCNRLSPIYPAVASFSWLPIHLFRIGITNGLLLSLVTLLAVLMYYLSQAHSVEGNKVNFRRIYQLLTFAYLQFTIVFLLTGIWWTFLAGAAVFVIFLAIDYILVIKFSLKLNNTLKRRKDDIYWAEGGRNSTYFEQEKIITMFQRRVFLFLTSLTIYLLSVLCSTVGNWVGLIPADPCFFQATYDVIMPEPSTQVVLASGYISAVFLILCDLGIIQFDAVLTFLNMGYLCSKYYYSRIAHGVTRRETDQLLADYKNSLIRVNWCQGNTRATHGNGIVKWNLLTYFVFYY